MSDRLKWFTIHPEIRMFPGARVTALQPFEGHVDLFVTGPDGAVWSTFFEPNGGWRPWFVIGSIRMQPGATVTVLQPFEGHVDLFVTGTDGAVWSTFFEPNGGWRPWFVIGSIRMQPGATVTVLQPFEGHVDLFVTGTDGAVWSTFFEPNGGWRPWFTIHPEIKMFPGAIVTVLQPATQPFKAHVDLFATGTDGAVWSTFFEPDGGWRSWMRISPDRRMNPGASISVPVNDVGIVFLVAAGSDGTMWSTFFEPNGGWRPWAAIHPEYVMQPGATAAVPLITWRSAAMWAGPIYVTDVCGGVWSTAYSTTDHRWASPGVRWERYWSPWSDIGSDLRLHPRSVLTVLELGTSDDHGFTVHTDVFATGPDGTVWTAFWELGDTSRVFRPDIPDWKPGEENRLTLNYKRRAGIWSFLRAIFSLLGWRFERTKQREF